MFGRVSNYFSGKVAAVESAGNQSSASTAARASSQASSVDANVVFKGLGTLYLKPTQSSRFEPLSSADVAVLTITTDGRDGSGRVQSRLCVVDPDEGDEPAIEQPVGAAMAMTYHHDTGAVMWQCVFDEELRELCFRFTGRGTDSQGFVEAFNRCVYASMTDGPSKASGDEDDDINYVAGTFSREQPIREKSPEPSAANVEEDATPLFTFDTKRERSIAPVGAAKASTKNLCFADSVKYNRAIVLRKDGACGDGIEARAFTYDTEGFGGAGEGFLVEGMANLTINDKKGNQSLLAADEKNFYALHDKGGIVDIDLTRGTVVQEYKPEAKYAAIAITNRSKFAENDPNLICCLSNNVAYSIDKRLDPTKCVVTEAGKDVSDYALGSLRKPMTCHATSAKGHLVIGDTIGDLRLYTGPPGTQREAGGYHPKTAKTLLKGTPNTAIVSVDITRDGKYVVAACAEHLMLFPLEYLDGTKTVNGCEGRMGKNKPSPLRLVPTADQLRAMKTAQPVFSSVRFDADKNFNTDKGSAQWIVATCNDFILTWQMDSVVKALENNRTVASDAVKEDGAVRQVAMDSGNKILFMTEKTIGAEKRSDKPVKKGFSYFHF